LLRHFGELDDGRVGELIASDDFRRQAARLELFVHRVEVDLDALGALDDVIVREDEATLGVEDEAAAGALDGFFALALALSLSLTLSLSASIPAAAKLFRQAEEVAE